MNIFNSTKHSNIDIDFFHISKTKIKSRKLIRHLILRVVSNYKDTLSGTYTICQNIYLSYLLASKFLFVNHNIKKTTKKGVFRLTVSHQYYSTSIIFFSACLIFISTKWWYAYYSTFIKR